MGPIEKAVIGKILEVSDAKDLEDLEAALIEENSDRTKEMSERLSSFNWTTVENDITNLAQKSRYKNNNSYLNHFYMDITQTI